MFREYHHWSGLRLAGRCSRAAVTLTLAGMLGGAIAIRPAHAQFVPVIGSTDQAVEQAVYVQGGAVAGTVYNGAPGFAGGVGGVPSGQMLAPGFGYSGLGALAPAGAAAVGGPVNPVRSGFLAATPLPNFPAVLANPFGSRPAEAATSEWGGGTVKLAQYTGPGGGNFGIVAPIMNMTSQQSNLVGPGVVEDVTTSYAMGTWTNTAAVPVAGTIGVVMSKRLKAALNDNQSFFAMGFHANFSINGGAPTAIPDLTIGWNGDGGAGGVIGGNLGNGRTLPNFVTVAGGANGGLGNNLAVLGGTTLVGFGNGAALWNRTVGGGFSNLNIAAYSFVPVNIPAGATITLSGTITMMSDPASIDDIFFPSPFDPTTEFPNVPSDFSPPSFGEVNSLNPDQALAAPEPGALSLVFVALAAAGLIGTRRRAERRAA